MSILKRLVALGAVIFCLAPGGVTSGHLAAATGASSRMPSHEQTSRLVQSAPQSSTTVSGTIRGDRRLLAGAVLTCRQGKRAWRASTNRRGAYRLALAPGRYTCTATANGYHAAAAALRVQERRDVHANFTLTARVSVPARPVNTSTPFVLPTPVATATPSGPVGGTTCMWFNGATLLTDQNAHYYQVNLRADPALMLTIAGTYPAARYASIQVYNVPSATFITGLHDTAFPPDPGSTNPFVSGGARGTGTYTLHAVFAPQPQHPVPGMLYINAAPGSFVTMVYRLYLTDAIAGPQGGVPLPTITASNISSNMPAGCPLPSYYPAVPTAYPWQSLVATPGPAPIGFTRLPGNQGDSYGNVDAAVLGARLDPTSGVYVIHFRAPPTPHTLAGGPVTGDYPLRYWSLCAVDWTGTARQCLVDEQIPVDAQGYVTIVLGATQARPPNATAANGVAWIDLGAFLLPYDLAMRQVIPSPSFTESAFAVPANAAPGPYMGAYAPQVVACSTTQFLTNRCGV